MYMLVRKFVCIASALICMYACMLGVYAGVGRLLWFCRYASALFYVYACEYCFCFVLCRCLYVSLCMLVYACRVGYVSWAGLLLGRLHL